MFEKVTTPERRLERKRVSACFFETFLQVERFRVFVRTFLRRVEKKRGNYVISKIKISARIFQCYLLNVTYSTRNFLSPKSRLLLAVNGDDCDKNATFAGGKWR